MNGRIWVALLVALLFGCDERTDKGSPVERFGLLETPAGQPLANAAITLANNVLGERTPFRLRGTWQKPTAAETRVIVTVYLIDGAAISSAYMVVVPTNCRCVFIQPAAFSAWMDDHTKRLPQMLQEDTTAVLAFMLLHEIGHIAHGDPGLFEEAHGGVALNLDATVQKERENAADRFAVDQVQAALEDKQAVDGWLAAVKMSMTLSGLSFNMSAMRMLEHFGATSLCSRAVFVDSGYSHPNFELRLIVANDLLSASPTSGDLLESFLTCRAKPNSGILLQRER